MRPTVTRGPVVSYTAVSPLPVEDGRSILCCAISQVTLGGRYPPSCSMEPGSSSADPNEDHGRGHQEVSSLQLYICHREPADEKKNIAKWRTVRNTALRNKAQTPSIGTDGVQIKVGK